MWNLWIHTQQECLGVPMMWSTPNIFEWLAACYCGCDEKAPYVPILVDSFEDFFSCPDSVEEAAASHARVRWCSAEGSHVENPTAHQDGTEW